MKTTTTNSRAVNLEVNCIIEQISQVKPRATVGTSKKLNEALTVLIIFGAVTALALVICLTGAGI